MGNAAFGDWQIRPLNYLNVFPKQLSNKILKPPLGSIIRKFVTITNGMTGLGLESTKRDTTVDATIVFMA